MDIKPTMSKFGFGHRNASHIIIDHDGELWLAMAPVAVGGFLPMGMTPLPGTLRVEPLENGEAVPFTYTAAESLLEVTTEKGASVRFAIDTCTQSLRIKGDGAFRLNGVESSSRATHLNTPEGVVISAGANRYVIAAKKGKITFDDAFVLKDFSSVTPVLEVEPEDGGFELYAFDLPTDVPVPIVTKTVEECAAQSAADFKAFCEGLVDVPAEWDDVKAGAAYPLWLCQRVLDGKNEVTVENKYNSKETNSWLMAITSMAFKDARRATDMILSYPVELPPVAGVAVQRLLDENMLNDSRGEIYRGYAALESVARMCEKERTVDGGDLSYYAYRFESGSDDPPEFFNAGEPVLAPDLNAYLIVVSDVIGKLARMEYDDGIARKWELHAKALTAKLIAELWDGEDFIGKNAYSGELSGPDKFLSLVPVILGSRLPAEIIKKLAAKIDAKAVESSVGLLLAGGLFDAGEKDAAKALVTKALEGARADGIRKPFYGAALLALAHKVL